MVAHRPVGRVHEPASGIGTVGAVSDRRVVIVSNRAPVSFHAEADGRLAVRRGAGGLISGLGPLVTGTDTVWVAAPLGTGDRTAQAHATSAGTAVIEAEGFRVRFADLDADDHRLAYDLISNQTLWFVHHGLFDHAREPTFEASWFEAWSAYERVNRGVAASVAEAAPPDAVVLVQDLHLALVASTLAELRPDLACVHFSHTPFATPEEWAVLPDGPRRALLAGMSAHRACGFHVERWAQAFRACHRADSGAEPPPTFVASLGPDPDDVGATAASAACEEAVADLDHIVGDRAFLVRVDRIELSKNILRGFAAYDHLLATRPEWRGRVIFGAFVYPSREGVAAYRRYREDVDAAVAAINARWATPGWDPIHYDASDDYPRSVAALRRADAFLVNPVRDGLNLVAKEGPLVNDRDAVLLLSRGAGAWDEIGDLAVTVPAFDVVGTADALAVALGRTRDERAETAARLRRRIAERTPTDWLADQLAAVGSG